jgi:ATP-dependent Lhr-like helicase
MSLSPFHPIIADWFKEKFGEPTEPQKLGWPHILSGEDTLIAAPTGSGKTFAAFLCAIDRLVRDGIAGRLTNEMKVLYISPLKALSSDVQRNLQTPLEEIQKRAVRQWVKLPEIRALVRTGDTPSHERQGMVRKPPHILVTTPESLYLLLTAPKSREILRTVETIIVDEIHAVARDKRGSHLALSLERLEALCNKRPVRIGLSATQRPMEEIARFLIGSKRVDANGHSPCAIVDVGHQRNLDLAIEVPPSELSAVCSNEQWAEVYHRLAELIQQHRSTLVFVNTRRLAERVTHQLTDLLGEDAVSSHHGSLSKKIRLKAEQRLKAGELKAVVATASLELGIDIGFIDLVIQVGSPRSIATFLQRVGRSGHALGLTPKGRLFALTRDELIEAAALIRAVRGGRLDRIIPPEAPVDILAQQIIAETADREIDERALFELCRGAWPYRHLTRQKFDDVVQMLSEGFSTRLGRSGAYLHHDRVNKKIKARRGARLAAITSGGAIPELADYRVIAEPEKIVVGSVDEDFAVESLAGDVFLLGNTSWRIIHVRGGDVVVTDAHGAPPTIPFWRGEAPARTVELSAELSDLRQALSDRVDRPEEAAAWLREEAHLDEFGARQMVHYAQAQKAAIGVLPTQRHLLFERFFDESGGMQMVIHSPFGGRINRAWGLALRKRFCRTFDFELQASADDNGIVLSLGPQQSFPLEQVAKMLRAEQGREILIQALLAAPMFNTRWRWNANRALAVLRQRNGKRVPPALQRMKSDDLLCAVFPQQVACRENLPGGDIPIPDHPLVEQTILDCLHEAMDLDGWLDLLRAIERGEIEITAADTREPTPFAYQILNASPYAFLDDAPLEERRARAVATRRTLTVESVRDIGRLDPLAIEQVRKEAWPLVRDADELHDALLLMGMLPAAEGEAWTPFLHTLHFSSRVVEARDPNGRSFWIAVEQWPMIHAARPDLIPQVAPSIPEGIRRDWSASEGWVALVRGRLEVVGPTTMVQIAHDFGLDSDHVESALGALEAEGFVLRGHFTPNAAETEWCARRLLARIHRLTLDRLRRQIEPAPVEIFLQFLLQWHRLLPKTQLHGREGLFSVIEQLQGFEIPAAAWERIILPSRIARYNPAWLDELCLNGEVAWGRLSPPASKNGLGKGSATRNNGEEPGRPRQATRNLPISLMAREDLGWLRTLSGELPFLSENAKTVLEALRRQGASFISDLLAATRLLSTQIDEALWELVAAGLVTGDGFSAVRLLTDPNRAERAALSRRRRGWKRTPRARGSGRWTIFPAALEALSPEERAEAWAWQLLQRYGILFRDLLGREEGAPAWYELLPILRRLEQRGEIRGGRFVLDVGGEQYGLPEAVEALRHLKQHLPEPEIVFLSAVDPLNLIGILTPGRRVTALPSNAVAFHGGAFAGSREGREIWVSEKLQKETARQIERTLTSGRLLALEAPGEEGAGEMEQIGLLTE